MFRPYARQTSAAEVEEGDDIEEEVSKEFDQTMLFCYQSKFMKDMVAKYGDSVACLDATYKTTDYTVPLFFIVVKSPVGYVIGRTLIVQFETSACISEALSVSRK